VWQTASAGSATCPEPLHLEQPDFDQSEDLTAELHDLLMQQDARLIDDAEEKEIF
jgi:hypothetical protein